MRAHHRISTPQLDLMTAHVAGHYRGRPPVFSSGARVYVAFHTNEGRLLTVDENGRSRLARMVQS